MWQKIKCWLGWHEWEIIDTKEIQTDTWGKYWIEYRLCYICKHCGKVKR